MALLLCVLALSTLVMTRGITVGEFSYNVDESQHAATGLFFADVVREHPFSHLVQFTYGYYAHYPALSGVIHWPPFFYFFEGLMFLALGPTVVAARLTTLLFALMGLSFWFLLVKEIQDEWTAALSTLLLALSPTVLLFEKTVMLEIPSLSLCIAATYFWTRYLLQEKTSAIYWFAVLASFAMLTKQNSVYLALFCALSGLWFRGWRLILRREFQIMLVIGVVLVAPFYTLVYFVHWRTIAMDLSDGQVTGGARWLFYLTALPSQVGWTFLGLSLLGLLLHRKWNRQPQIALLMVMWIVACYVTMTLIGHKEPRYVIYWLPPFFYFASGLLTSFFQQRALKIAAAATAVVIAATSLVSAWQFRRPCVSGYSVIAKRITESGRSGVILYDGALAANFIFFIRAEDPTKQFLVLRKALYSTRLHRRGGTVELVHSEREIEDVIHDDGVRFIVVSEGLPLYFKSQELLRDLLKRPQFSKLGTFSVVGDDLPVHNTTLELYENLAWTPPRPGELRIKMLTLDHDIVMPIDNSGAFAAQ